MGDSTVSEAILRRERLIVAAGLVILCLLAWIFVIAGAGTGTNAASTTSWQFPPEYTGHNVFKPWNPVVWILMVVMWWVMMIAMMVPSAAPMILLYARVYRRGQGRDQISHAPVPTSLFVSGYLIAWLVFSVFATTIHWLLERLNMVHTVMMWSTNQSLSGAFLAAAGIYQLSPLKHICLKHCRTPVDYLSRHWRPGASGALRMGVEHGLFCVGCCWFLMVLLFVGGVMNLVWIAGLAAFVLIEKLTAHGYLFGRISGGLMILTGLILLI